jgi:hypothetical protein
MRLTPVKHMSGHLKCFAEMQGLGWLLNLPENAHESASVKFCKARMLRIDLSI